MRKRKNDSGVEGVVVVDKPAGITSHDVVAKLRRILGTRTIGHAGTLDPFATGVLVVMVGRYTRLSNHLTQDDKSYDAEIFLGSSTTTGDGEGDTVDEGDAAHVTMAAVSSVCDSFLGAQKQTVPAFSAVSVDGERLYEKARRGEDVERPVRDIVVRTLNVGEVTLGKTALVNVSTTVSKGTYIRVLASDIGTRLGVPAHCRALRRTASGAYTLADAVSLDDVERRGAAVLMVGPTAVRGIPLLQIDDDAAHMLRMGKTIGAPLAEAPLTLALAILDDDPIALVQEREACLHVVRGFGPKPLPVTTTSA